MGIRGRSSSVSLSVVPADGVLAVRRPDPPSFLTDEQAEIWRAVVSRMVADWFTPETFPLLSQYCRHVIAANKIAQLVQQIECESQDPEENPASVFFMERYDRLLKMQEREGRAIATLATKMRIAQQSTYDKSKKKPSASRKPWQTQEDAAG